MDADITIIGAGIVGLAIAEKISNKFINVFLIEKHKTFGQETSSRNSEVIHAGIYYPENSLKSKLCIEGKSLLYDFCIRYEIPFKKCGKFIVATSAEEIPIIEEISRTALKNGINDIVIMGKNDILGFEPNIFALKALFSPSTGIIDTHTLMKRFETNILNNGGQIVYGSEVTALKRIDNGYSIELTDGDNDKFSFCSKIVINSAGLSSDKISGMAGLEDDNLRIHFCKGEYFRLNPCKNRLVNRLIFPVPYKNLEGLGIHVTKDIGGGVRLGPDISYLETETYNYKVDPAKQSYYYNSAKKFLPFLEFDDLSPDMAGIRPKLQKPDEPIRDFYIAEESERGFPGFINLIGIESPGLTSSIAIANYVLGMIKI